MIRPASEIEFPPSDALCTKARMIARMERLSNSVDGVMSVIAQRMTETDTKHAKETQILMEEQDMLLRNMRRHMGS